MSHYYRNSNNRHYSNGVNHIVNPNVQDIVVFNEEFNENVPMYYLDSGIVITFGLIKILEEAGFSDNQIRNAIIRGSRDTVNNEPIEGNPRNIDEKTAEILIRLYKANKKGEVAFCIPPAVYKETMIDGLAHDDARRQFTRRFIRQSCFLVFPNENLLSFAKKTAFLEGKLKRVKSKDGEFGLNPELKTKKVNGQKLLVDANFEDRLILSQVAVMTKQGKQRVQFVSLSNSDELANNAKVQNLYDESKKVEQQELEAEESVAEGSDSSIFLQINSKDFGKKCTSRRSPVAVGKNDVSEQIVEVLDEFFDGNGEMKVCTPDELSK